MGLDLNPGGPDSELAFLASLLPQLCLTVVLKTDRIWLDFEKLLSRFKSFQDNEFGLLLLQ